MEKAIDEAARQRGFASSAAFVRYAIEQELTGSEDDLTGAEERVAGSIKAVRRDLFRVMRVQQALFAYLDTLAKAFLTCAPEPPADAKAQAVARARERHDRLLKRQAGQWSENRSWRCTIWWSMSKNEEREFRLRPRKPPILRQKGEGLRSAAAFKTLAHFARASHIARGVAPRRSRGKWAAAFRN